MSSENESPRLHKVILLPSGQQVNVPEGKALLHALREQGVYIKSTCGGVASCGDCVVKIHSGESCLTPSTFAELKLLGNVYHITRERLSCQTMVVGDCTIDIGEHDKARDQEKMLSKTSSNKRPGVVTRKKGEIPVRSGNNAVREEKAQRPGGGARVKKFNYTEEE